MPRVLVSGTWFDLVGSNAYWEAEFEQVILNRSSVLFPGYNIVEFRRTVYSDHGAKQPDFALIDSNYRSWWVVEVELSHHSLYGHVLPQIEVFSNANYGDSEAQYLAARAPHLDAGRLEEMMRGAPPRVLVLVNRLLSSWETALRPYGALVCAVEMYRNDRNEHIVRVDGSLPRPPTAIVTPCRVHPLLPQLVVVDAPAALGIGPGEHLFIEYDGSVTEWERFDSGDGVWLNPLRTNPLPPRTTVYLVRDDDGRLTFRRESD